MLKLVQDLAKDLGHRLLVVLAVAAALTAVGQGLGGVIGLADAANAPASLDGGTASHA